MRGKGDLNNRSGGDRGKSVGRNYLSYLSYQALSLLCPLVLTPYFARVLGPDRVGLFSFAEAVLSYFLLFAALGTAAYGQRAVSYARDDPEARSRAFWETFLLRLVASALTLFSYLCYVRFGAEEGSRALALVLGLEIVGSAFDVSWFLQGTEDFGRAALCGGAAKLLGVALTFLFVRSGGDLKRYALISAGCALLGNGTMWLGLPRKLRRVHGIRPFRNLKPVLQLFLPAIAVQAYTVLDKSMLGWLCAGEGYSENGYYEQAEKLVKAAVTAVTAFGAVLSPRIAHAYRMGRRSRADGYLAMAYRYALLLGIPAMFGFIAVADVFVPVYFGAGYGACVPLVRILSAVVPLIGFSNVTGMQYFVPSGRQNALTLTVLTGAAVNFCCNFALIPRFGAVGASVGTVAAEFSVTLLGLRLLKKSGAMAQRSALAGLSNYLPAGLGMFFVVLLLKRVLPADPAGLILLILAGAGTYFLALLFLRDGFLLRFARGKRKVELL